MSQQSETIESPREIEPHHGFSIGGYVKSRQFLVRIAIAAVMVAIFATVASAFLVYGALAASGVLVVPITRARSFAIAFIPYVAVWVIFTFLRSFADGTIIAETLNTKVANFERWIFNGQLPTVSLQDRFYDPTHLHWYDYYFTFTHWSYFIIPHVVAIRLWYKHPARFKQYLFGLILMLSMGLMIYFLIPSNPPWMAPEPINSPAAAPVYRVMEEVAKHVNGGLYQASNSVIGQSNPIAAMPSMHMAMTFFLVFPAYHAGKKWFIASLYYALTMGLTLVYCGEHYVIDVVMGSLVASYGWLAAGLWLRSAVPVLRNRTVTAARTATVPQRTEFQPVEQPVA